VALLLAAVALTRSPAAEIPAPGQSQPVTEDRAAAESHPRDVLLLNTGQRLEGRVLDTKLTLRTSYGVLSLPVAAMSAIQLLDGEHNLRQVATVNSNRYTGFLEETGLRFQISDQAPIEIRRERLSKVWFGERGVSFRTLPASRWVRLRNGDILSGHFLTESVALLIGDTNSEIHLNEIACTFSNTNGLSDLVIRETDGRIGHGRLASEGLEFLLDTGPRLNLYAGLIERLGSRENLSESIADSSTVAPVNSSTNLEGFVWIPAGQFLMGSPTEELGRDSDEGPQTRVILPHGFWIGKHETTQRQYQSVMGANPSNATGDANRPVERVTWFEAVEYCRKLTDQAEAAGRLPEGYAYRLPTEAEWEYACRAGTATRFSFGEDKNATELEEYAWFTRNSESVTHPVGTRKPNPWGLSDMHGNVWEWCWDRWEDALPGGTVTNKPVSAVGTLRIARGGSWLYEPKACRSANRDDYSPWNRCSDVGFRVVLAPVQ